MFQENAALVTQIKVGRVTNRHTESGFSGDGFQPLPRGSLLGFRGARCAPFFYVPPGRGRDGVLAISLGQKGQAGIPAVPTADLTQANARQNASPSTYKPYL